MERYSETRRNLRLAYAASAFSHSRRMAKECAAQGNRESARWWGQTARQDWQVLKPLIFSAH